MKAITFILILVASVCHAQNGQTESEIALLQVRESKHTHYEIKYEGYDPVIRLSDLIDYETECYNDSAAYAENRCVWNPQSWTAEYTSCKYEFVRTTDGYVQQCIIPDHIVTKWRHREPTMTGFIQWLKNEAK